MLASSGLHATRSSSIASLNCKSAWQKSFFMRIARRLLLLSLISSLELIPFYEQPMTDKCSISYKRINGTLPSYLNDHIIINNNRHGRNTRQYKYCMSQVLQRNRGRTNFFSICGETMEQCPVRYRQGRLATLF